MKFALGKVVITASCLAYMQSIKEQPFKYLMRHVSGDWGDLSAEDNQANDFAINRKVRILSHYFLCGGQSIYVITEHDRSQTTILLRHEY